MYLELWALSIADDIRIGAVFLLAALTTPLSAAMFCYHIYLIWAGMTTNESAKWSDWRDDIANGIAFQAKASQIYGQDYIDEHGAQFEIPWPKQTDQTLVFTANGQPPKEGHFLTQDRLSAIQPSNPDAQDDPRWLRVKSMGEVVNLYDCGFRSNLLDSLGFDIRPAQNGHGCCT